MSILSKISITRDGWIDKVYSKSHSINSKEKAIQALKKWDEFLSMHPITESDLFLEVKQNNNSVELYMFLDRFVQFLAKSQEYNGIKIYFGMIKSWLRYNGIRIYNEDVKQFVTFPKQQKERRRPLQFETIHQLINNSSGKLRGILLVLMSSGMRVSEVLQLKVSDLDVTSNPVRVNIRAETTKTREARHAYISTECYQYIRKFVEDKSPNDYIFVKSYNPSSRSVAIMFQRLRKKLGLTETYGNGLYHTNIHSFRSFFHSEATKILGGDIAHAMIGHHNYLDQYFRMTESEQMEMYRKVEPYVTVSKEFRQQLVIEQKNKQLQKMSDLESKVKSLMAFKKRWEDRRK